MAKHWECENTSFNEYSIFEVGGEVIAKGMSWENARLIATAPEMIDLLTRALTYVPEETPLNKEIVTLLRGLNRE